MYLKTKQHLTNYNNLRKIRLILFTVWFVCLEHKWAQRPMYWRPFKVIGNYWY